MTACVEWSPVLPARTNKRSSYPLATSYSAPVQSREASASRLLSPSASPSPKLVSPTKSLPSLATLLSDAISPVSPIELDLPPDETDASNQATPKKTNADEQITPRKAVTPRQSLTDLTRSASMPAVTDESTSMIGTAQDPPFPSPSSSFHPPAPQQQHHEGELIKELLDSRTRAQSDLGGNRPSISTDTRSPYSSKGSSTGPGRSALPASPAVRTSASGSRSRKQSLREDGTPTSVPMSAVSSSAFSTADLSRPPSRPPSAYSEPVVTLTPGLARRLSLSTSRRGSDALVQQAKRIVVRDFAFPPTDPRFWGEGMQASLPPPVSRLSSGLWSASNNSSRTQLQSWEEVANDVQEELTSRGSTSTFSWGFITSHAEADAVDHMADSPIEEEEPEDQAVDLGPIPEGGALFMATYAFEPEADQEMGLGEGEVVKVYERICQGWVVAGRLKRSGAAADAEEETGLVPENYLAPYKADADAV